MSAIRFDQSVCQDTAECFQREWLETNGRGGFASSTISGANTRRYHALLVAATEPPTVRYVLLSKLEETLVVGDQRYELSTNRYLPGVVHPEGYRCLIEFRLDPFPVFTFSAGGVKIEKRVFLVQGEDSVVVEYEVVDGPACRLEVRPLVAFRGYHDLTHANDALNPAVDERSGEFSIRPYRDLPELHFAHNARAMNREGNWYFHFEYLAERERGLDFEEDLFCPCVMEFDVGPGIAAVVVASTGMHRADEVAALKAAEVSRRAGLGEVLRAAADQFIVRRGALHTVIAGYPWFGDWGRDTMIALPGLTLSTGRFDVARDILLAFAGYLDQGMLPNAFPDAGQMLEYNTVDATLWFFEAVRRYLEASGDVEFVRAPIYEKLKDVIGWHVRGTRFSIHMDADGLLNAGDETTQLTWMDARVDGRPVTSRNGKAVEIQGLWYNALRFTAKLADDFADADARALYEGMAAKAGESFNASFWNEGASCLYDAISWNNDGAVRDASIRPNQVIALSLGYCAIGSERARRILDVVKAQLLTPFGLRTLAPSDPGYRGRYEGSVAARDSAYHQGTVWPWLLGPYVTAQRRFNGDDAGLGITDALGGFMLARGTGQIPEIFDGDAPHAPRGCFAQAWSVGEMLRIGG